MSTISKLNVDAIIDKSITSDKLADDFMLLSDALDNEEVTAAALTELNNTKADKTVVEEITSILEDKVDVSVVETIQQNLDSLTTTVINKADASELSNYLPLTGGTLTGDLSTNAIIPVSDSTYAIGTYTKRFSSTWARSFISTSGATNEIDKNYLSLGLRINANLSSDGNGYVSDYGFSTTNNANGVLSFRTTSATASNPHYYLHQLGFSGNGNLYHRYLPNGNVWSNLTYPSLLKISSPVLNEYSSSPKILPEILNDNICNIFHDISQTQILIERSQDGTTWTDTTETDYPKFKQVMSSGKRAEVPVVAYDGANGQVGDRVRITINGAAAYTRLSHLYVYYSTYGNTTKFTVEKNSYEDQEAWTTLIDKQSCTGWPGPNYYGLNDSYFGRATGDAGYSYRLTFEITAITSGQTNIGYVYNIWAFSSDRPWSKSKNPNEMFYFNVNKWRFVIDKSLEPLANNTYSLGASSAKWYNIYTSKINDVDVSEYILPQTLAANTDLYTDASTSGFYRLNSGHTSAPDISLGGYHGSAFGNMVTVNRRSADTFAQMLFSYRGDDMWFRGGQKATGSEQQWVRVQGSYAWKATITPSAWSRICYVHSDTYYSTQFILSISIERTNVVYNEKYLISRNNITQLSSAKYVNGYKLRLVMNSITSASQIYVEMYDPLTNYQDSYSTYTIYCNLIPLDTNYYYITPYTVVTDGTTMPEGHVVGCEFTNEKYDVIVNGTLKSNTSITSPKFITSGGTNSQVVLGDGTLKNVSELGSSSLTYATLSNTNIINAGFNYNNTYSGLTIDTYTGFTVDTPDTVIVSTFPITFTGSCMKMDGLENLSGTYYIYCLSYMANGMIAINGAVYN